MKEYKKDCFAFIKEGRCFALSDMNCGKCQFYKKSENPLEERKEIIEDCKMYAKAHEGSK